MVDKQDKNMYKMCTVDVGSLLLFCKACQFELLIYVDPTTTM
jgi:hypothetical protein